MQRFRIHCDQFFSTMLNAIRFSPISTKDRHTSGIKPNNGLGGVGYSYWFSPSKLKLHENLDLLRRISRCDLSFDEAEEIICAFIDEFIKPLIAGQFGWQTSNASLAECLSDEVTLALQSEFYSAIITASQETWFWFPLNSVTSAGYVGEHLILASIPTAEGIGEKELEDFLNKPILSSATVFLGIRARSKERAIERSSIFLGSLFLSMHSQTQFTHTMGRPTEGVLQFNHHLTYFSSRKHLPFLAHPIHLDSSDLPWIKRVEHAILGKEADRKMNRSLRWLHAAWFAFGAERYTLICQAVDALTPSSAKSMSAKCQWILQNLSPSIAVEAIELLFKTLRSDVMHGDAPSLIESSAYVDFHTIYGLDPVEVSVEIVRRLMLQKVLPDVRPRPHPMELWPDSFQQKKQMFARYGLNYELSIEMDLSPIM